MCDHHIIYFVYLQYKQRLSTLSSEVKIELKNPKSKVYFVYFLYAYLIKKKCFGASSCTIISLTPSCASLQKHTGFVLVFLEVFYYSFGGLRHVNLISGTFNPTFTMNVILPEVILLTKIIVNISSLYCISCPY